VIAAQEVENRSYDQSIQSAMNDSYIQVQAIERFRPDPDRLYDVDTTARLAGVPRRSVLVYCRWGLVHPTTSPEVQGWYFSSEAIGAIRRAEYLRANRGVNLAGLRVIFELMDEFGRRRPTFW
jgi:hypothetical protein